MVDKSKIYPDPDRIDIEFEHAKPLNRYFGSSLIRRDGGYDDAERIAGLRRDAERNRRIELWRVEKQACIIRVRHRGNSFYFEILEDEIEEELQNLVAEGNWWVDHISDEKLMAIISDEFIPDDGFIRNPEGW